MKYFILILIIGLTACRKNCTLLLIEGNYLLIPIQFNEFTMNELNTMRVIRKSHNSLIKNDTFGLEDIAWGHQIKGNQITITDNDLYNRFGYYESYFNDCELIFKWNNASDTFKNMVILKSKENIKDKCHQDDPNIRIDKVTFEHKGKLINKDELVNIQF